MSVSFLLEENSNIRDFFEGKDSSIPISEFQYLHTHPLVRPNFLTQIMDKVDGAGKLIVAKAVKGPILTKFENLAIRLGTPLPNMNEDIASNILFTLRELYTLCNELEETLK